MAKKKKVSEKEVIAVDIQPKQPKVRCINHGQAPSFFVNRVEMGFSNFEFRLKFQEVLDGTPEQINVRDLATVYLTPAHTMMVASLFGVKLKEYKEYREKVAHETAELSEGLPKAQD